MRVNVVFYDEQVFAAIFSGKEVAGHVLPSHWGCLRTRLTGDQHYLRSGESLAGDPGDEFFLVRTTPHHVEIRLDGLLSLDSYPVSCQLSLMLQAGRNRLELAAMRKHLLAASRIIRSNVLTEHITPHIRTGIMQYARLYSAGNLQQLQNAGEILALIRNSAEPWLFHRGLQIQQVGHVQFDSPAHRDDLERHRRLKSVRQLVSLETQLELATQRAQQMDEQDVQRRLEELQIEAKQNPRVMLVDLIGADPPAIRHKIYDAICSGEPHTLKHQKLVIAAGEELVFFDPAHLNRSIHRAALGQEVGSVRSIVYRQTSQGAGRLWVGAARGIHACDADSGELLKTYPVTSEETIQVRGGFNRAERVGTDLYATHSELGLWRWPLDRPEAGTRLFECELEGMSAIRHIQFAQGRMWFSAGSEVVSFSLAGEGFERFGGSATTITSLVCTEKGLWAGNASGQILYWEGPAGSSSTVFYEGIPRPVDSLELISEAGLEQVCFANTSTSAEIRLIGDDYRRRYQAGGQVIAQVRYAAGLLVGINEIRDRLFIWETRWPDCHPAVLPFTRLCGRSIQDVCII